MAPGQSERSGSERQQLKNVFHAPGRWLFCAREFKNNGFICCVRRLKGVYLGDPFDFVAAYVTVEDVWYIIPAAGILGKQSVTLAGGKQVRTIQRGLGNAEVRDSEGTDQGIRGHRDGCVVGFSSCQSGLDVHCCIPR